MCYFVGAIYDRRTFWVLARERSEARSKVIHGSGVVEEHALHPKKLAWGCVDTEELAYSAISGAKSLYLRT